MSSGAGCGCIVLVRHGQSHWNLENRFTGWKDIHLTEKGLQQAEDTARLLMRSEINFHRAFVSKLTRAQQTLEAMVALGQWTDIPVVAAEELNERNYGDLTGQNKQEASQKYGEQQVHAWRRSFSERPPRGESLEDTAARTVPWLKSNVLPPAQRGETVLVVAHGNSLRAAVMALEKLTPEQIVEREIATGEPIAYSVDPDGSSKRLVI